ncbi:hypothetical protein [Phytohabitans kaempferiae]|uniref:PIN domain-containing protein n=1 Tax=Phytohabitans kaempferiae TaxID=1620943 RepID=A0ABV6M560_9ACTN
MAGLTDISGERHRRELSCLIHEAIAGGPVIDVPALCLAEASTARRSIAEHVADLVASAPPGALAVRELVRGAELDTVLTTDPTLDWAGTHAVLRARASGRPILTLCPDRYDAVAVDALPL